MDDPDMGVWTYTYDANGNLKTQTDYKSQTVTFDIFELYSIHGDVNPHNIYAGISSQDKSPGGFRTSRRGADWCNRACKR